MFDAFKSALFGAGASFAIPDAFSLDDLASLSRKVRDEPRRAARRTTPPARTPALWRRWA